MSDWVEWTRCNGFRAALVDIVDGVNHPFTITARPYKDNKGASWFSYEVLARDGAVLGEIAVEFAGSGEPCMMEYRKS